MHTWGCGTGIPYGGDDAHWEPGEIFSLSPCAGCPEQDWGIKNPAASHMWVCALHERLLQGLIRVRLWDIAGGYLHRSVQFLECWYHTKSRSLGYTSALEKTCPQLAGGDLHRQFTNGTKQDKFRTCRELFIELCSRRGITDVPVVAQSAFLFPSAWKWVI